MPDSNDTFFNDVRPLLMLAASALQEHLVDALDSEQLAAEVTVRVATSADVRELAETSGTIADVLKSSDRLISATIVIRDIQTRSGVERLLQRRLTLHTQDWVEQSGSANPIRRFAVQIPPFAMPDGWADAPVVPTQFELQIQVFEGTAKVAAQLPRLRIVSNTDKALVMKGGGIKGLAYLGALEVIWEHHKFNWFVGTSAGAITAVLLGAGYTPTELIEEMKKKDFCEFFDSKTVFKKIITLLNHHGLHHAENCTNWIDGLLNSKTGKLDRVKLSEIQNRITVFASRGDGDPIVFDKILYDRFASHAVRCSMSIPFYFVPQDEQGYTADDGGLQNNYPIEWLTKNSPDTPFVGLYLGNAYEGQTRPSWWRRLLRLAGSLTASGELRSVDAYRDQTIVIDPRPIETLDFDLLEDEKEFLLACGRAAGHRFIKSDIAVIEAAETHRDWLKQRVVESRSRRSQTRRFWRQFMLSLLLGGLSYFSFRWSPILGISSLSLTLAVLLDALAKWIRINTITRWAGAITFVVSCVLFSLIFNVARSQGHFTIEPIPGDMQLVFRINKLPEAPDGGFPRIFRVKVTALAPSEGRVLAVSTQDGVILGGLSEQLPMLQKLSANKIEGLIGTGSQELLIDIGAASDQVTLPQTAEAYKFFKVYIDGHELEGRLSNEQSETY